MGTAVAIHSIQSEANSRGARMLRSALGAAIAGYLEDDAIDPAAVAYGPNLPRLREIKTKYDSGNLFRHNVNILPE